MHKDWYVAFVPIGTSFDSVTHRVQQGRVEKITIVETESERRARLAITVRRAADGTFSPLPNRQVFVSRELEGGSIKLIATGILTEIPFADPNDESITLEYNCSPTNIKTLESNAIDYLKNTLAYDRVLVARGSENDRVEILDGLFLETHCNRATHAVTPVDLFGAGLPVIDINTMFMPGPSIIQTHKPVTDVAVEMTAEWTQYATGTLDATSEIIDAFDGHVSTLTPDRFENAWFVPDQAIANLSGWTVEKSTLEEIEVPISQPAEMGPVSAASSIYNYVDDPNLDNPLPIGFSFPVSYYDIELVLRWTIEQKRVETVSFILFSEHQGSIVGTNQEVLRLQVEDLQSFSDEPEWQPLVIYETGDIVRVGWQTYQANFTHQSSELFSVDVGTRWTAVSAPTSPLPSPSANTYFRTSRGEETIAAAIFKAAAIIKHGQRCIEITFRCPVKDEYLDLDTRHRVRLLAPSDMIPGGEVTAKVVSMELHSSQDDEYYEITLAAAIGSGASRASGLSQNQQPWDRVSYNILTGNPPLFPPFRVDPIVENKKDEQLQFVQDNDFNPSAGRTDPDETDPETLLREVPTTVQLALVPLVRPTFRHSVGVIFTEHYAGPRQFELGA